MADFRMMTPDPDQWTARFLGLPAPTKGPESDPPYRLEVYEPEGQRFFCKATRREMLLVAPGQAFAGWVCYRHPDGQWVTLRPEPTQDDWKAIDAAEALGYRGSNPERT